MKITYDKPTDTLTIPLKAGSVAESDEEHPGIILDYDEAGDVIGLEILNASRRIPDVSDIEFQETESGDLLCGSSESDETMRRFEIMARVADTLANESQDIEPEFAEIIDRHFWDLA